VRACDAAPAALRRVEADGELTGPARGPASVIARPSRAAWRWRLRFGESTGTWSGLAPSPRSTSCPRNERSPRGRIRGGQPGAQHFAVRLAQLQHQRPRGRISERGSLPAGASGAGPSWARYEAAWRSAGGCGAAATRGSSKSVSRLPSSSRQLADFHGRVARRSCGRLRRRSPQRNRSRRRRRWAVSRSRRPDAGRDHQLDHGRRRLSRFPSRTAPSRRLVQVPWVDVTRPRAVPDGRPSETLTPAASSGPLFGHGDAVGRGYAGR